MQGMKNPGRDAQVFSFSAIRFSPDPRGGSRSERANLSGFRDDDRYQPFGRTMPAMAYTTRSCSETKAPRPSSPSWTPVPAAA